MFFPSPAHGAREKTKQLKNSFFLPFLLSVTFLVQTKFSRSYGSLFFINIETSFLENGTLNKAKLTSVLDSFASELPYWFIGALNSLKGQDRGFTLGRKSQYDQHLNISKNF